MGNLRDGLHVYDIFSCNIVGSAPFSAIDLPDLTNTIEHSTSCAGGGIREEAQESTWRGIQ